jgi:hypothetical protein
MEWVKRGGEPVDIRLEALDVRVPNPMRRGLRCWRRSELALREKQLVFEAPDLG